MKKKIAFVLFIALCVVFYFWIVRDVNGLSGWMLLALLSVVLYAAIKLARLFFKID